MKERLELLCQASGERGVYCSGLLGNDDLIY